MSFDSVLQNAAEVIEGVKPNDFVVYGLNLFTAETVLVQPEGSGYRDIVTVDSAMNGGNFSEMPCGAVITREPNKLVFDLPPFWRNLFVVAQLSHESGNEVIYNRLILEYGLGLTREIGRASLTDSDRRCQSTLVASYGGLAPSNSMRQNKLHIETYDNQQYFGANIVIGIRL